MSYDWRSAVRANLPAVEFWAKLTPISADDRAVQFCKLAVENDDVGEFVDGLMSDVGFGAAPGEEPESLEAKAERVASPAARQALAAAGFDWQSLVAQLLPVILAALLKR